jgi:hypothetical protein
MKKRVSVFALLIATATVTFPQTNPAPSTPKKDRVPDAETAVMVGEKALIKVYGSKQILSERPFTAVLDGDVWTVYGALYRGSKRHTEPCVGGVAQVEIRKTSGRILNMQHTM